MKPEERSLLLPGALLVANYLGTEYKCQLVSGSDGSTQYEVAGLGPYTSPSGAANAVVRHANPSRPHPNTNGYAFWDLEQVSPLRANTVDLQSAPAATDPPSGRHWWVNQGSTHRQEVEGGYLWAPVTSRSGREVVHHRNMAELQAGDTVFHYWAGEIQAVSRVLEAAVRSSIPDELPDQAWEQEGRRASVAVVSLDEAVPLQDIPVDWRLDEGGPFNRNGAVNQGYLYPLSDEFVVKLAGRFPQCAEHVTIDPGLHSDSAAAYVEPNLEAIGASIERAGLVVSARTLRRFTCRYAHVASSSSLASQELGRHGSHRHTRELAVGSTAWFRLHPIGRLMRTCLAT